MRNRIIKDSLRPRDSKSYVGDYVHTVYEPTGDLVLPLGKSTALVGPGESVLVGQKLSEGGENGALSIHSPCSGTIRAIERRRTAVGTEECIVLENDRKFRPAEGLGESVDWQELSRSDILRRIREGGALGIRPKRFPTAAALDKLASDAVSRVVVDASEWEPIVSSDDDILRTCGYGVIEGLRILLRLFPGAEGAVLVGDDKPRAADVVREALYGAAGIRIQPVPAGVPTGGEGMIESILASAPDSERSVCLVATPAEAYAVYEAVSRSTPFFRRIVTVAGSAVKNPGNYMVRLGTSCAELLAAAGGLRPGAEAKTAVLGGPLTGVGLTSLDVPVGKDSGALLVFAEEEESGERSECIRCGRCAEACPAGLLPMELMKAAQKSDMDRYENRLHGRACISCGLCSWICPAGQPLAQAITYGRTLLK